MKKRIRNTLLVIVFILSTIISCWLGIGVMLVGGIQQAIEGFRIMDDWMAAWGIVRAIFFEIGLLPFWLGIIITLG